MTADVDLYAILGVQRDASQDDIKRAYRKLARQYHPDLNSGDPELEERFKQATMAYEILSDPAKRSQYDQFGTTRPGGGMGFEGFGNVSDVFEFFFGGGFGGFGNNQRKRRDPAYSDGKDILETVTLELKDVLAERSVTLNIRRLELCPECKGSRAEPGTHPTDCRHCAGNGVLSNSRQTILGIFSTSVPCPNCHGTGKLIETPCKACHGNGVSARDRSIDLTIPAGITDSTVLRLGGIANAGTGGGHNGDVMLRVRVKPHAVFTVEGPDLFAELPLSYPEVALGTDVNIEHPSGEKLRVKIPPRTQPGEVITLRSQGMPRLNGRGNGDVHLQVKLDIPAKPSREEEKLLKSLNELNGKHADKGGIRQLKKLRSY
jgi:molecular chaperone DnaJ